MNMQKWGHLRSLLVEQKSKKSICEKTSNAQNGHLLHKSNKNKTETWTEIESDDVESWQPPAIGGGGDIPTMNNKALII